VKRAADLLEQWYSMSGNPHHFALPTPPSDHEGETSKFICFLFSLKHVYKTQIYLYFFFFFFN
jgi:hypothetical protein